MAENPPEVRGKTARIIQIRLGEIMDEVGQDWQAATSTGRDHTGARTCASAYPGK